MRHRASWVVALVMMGCSMAGGVDRDERSLVQPATSSEIVRREANALAPRGLASSALTTARLDSAGAAAMGGTAEARKVLAYAVGCALDSTQAISFVVDGVVHTAAGGIGIAPGWTSGPLSPAQAAWVSACVLAHANELSSVIWISVRGDHAGLTASASEQAAYHLEEGAFWGNVFVDRGPIAAYSCEGVDQAADDSYAELPDRECAQWDGVPGSNRSPCGMSYAGQCRHVCSTAIAPYAGCSFLGEPGTSTVVTTYLRDLDLDVDARP